MSYAWIPGWTCSEIEALYSEFADKLPAGSTVVEVGVAYGRSLAFLAERVRPGVKVVGVDCFEEHMGGDNLPPEVFKEMVSYGTPFETCKRNLRACLTDEQFDRIELIKETSVQASRRYSNNSLDLVFIDARHEYVSVCEDIAAWLPKVKAPIPMMSEEQGLLTGHDYDPSMFPGVVQAVNERFGKDIQVKGSVWRYAPYYCDDGGCRKCTYCLQHYGVPK